MSQRCPGRSGLGAKRNACGANHPRPRSRCKQYIEEWEYVTVIDSIVADATVIDSIVADAKTVNFSIKLPIIADSAQLVGFLCPFQPNSCLSL